MAAWIAVFLALMSAILGIPGPDSRFDDDLISNANLQVEASTCSKATSSVSTVSMRTDQSAPGRTASYPTSFPADSVGCKYLPAGTNAIYGALTQPDALNRRKNDIQISGSIRMSVGHLTPSVTDGGRAATVLPPVECFAN